MSDSPSWRDKYLALIAEIVEMTLKGKISSTEQIYQMLLQNVSLGTGEIFELTLSDRLTETQTEVAQQQDELKQAKAGRTLRALKTIQTQWERAQSQNKIAEFIFNAVKEVTTATPEQRLGVFLRFTDPNQEYTLTQAQLQQLIKSLQQYAQPESDLAEICAGVTQGIATWQRLQDNLVSWMYERQNNIGFGGIPGENSPWAIWAKQIPSPFPHNLFQTLAREASIIDFVAQQNQLSLREWLETAMILQSLQRGLVNWFDKQAYNISAGSKLSISTYLTFAVIWSYLGTGFNQLITYREACLQILLQILRNFAQRPYFPLYGGIFASFSGSYLRDALNYLDEPLKRVDKTQEKARILTLLGYSQRALGNSDRALEFHQQALEIARSADDRVCEIANLNHLSRTYVTQELYLEAIDYSQRALILSRQVGDKTGEANALINLGYSEVMQAQQQQTTEPETYTTVINYLEQGLRLSEQLGDPQSKALCLSSLGIAYLVTGDFATAIKHLEAGFNTAQVSGDLYLQGRNLTYLCQANYNLQNYERAIYTGSLGMYLLAQISSQEWRNTASMLLILRGQIGSEQFNQYLHQSRSRIIAIIGIDGYDYIPKLLVQFQEEM